MSNIEFKKGQLWSFDRVRKNPKIHFYLDKIVAIHDAHNLFEIVDIQESPQTEVILGAGKWQLHLACIKNSTLKLENFGNLCCLNSSVLEYNDFWSLIWSPKENFDITIGVDNGQLRTSFSFKEEATSQHEAYNQVITKIRNTFSI